jgi:predicted phosphodiesterase
MRIAIVSDVHGNLAALEAVLADLEAVAPDVVVHGGDLVLNGPRPAECIDAIRERGWPGVMGNTDEVLVDEGPTAWSKVPAPMVSAMRSSAAWARERLGEERLAWLAALGGEWRHGADVALVHAVPGNLWPVVRPDAPDDELLSVYGPLGSRIAVYCHIHVPYVRDVGDLTVANTGAAGSPFDGDPRASYLLITEGSCATRRVAYDVERAAAEAEGSGHPLREGMAWIYRTGRRPSEKR